MACGSGGISTIPGAYYSSETGGITGGPNGTGEIQNISNTSYTVYSNLNLTGATTFTASVASDNANAAGVINIYVGGPPGTGTLVGTCSAPSTGGWSTWTTVSCPLSNVPAGTQNVYLYFTGNGGGLMNVDWFAFNITL